MSPAAFIAAVEDFVCEGYEHDMRAASSAAGRAGVQARFDQWWDTIGSDPRKAHPTVMPGDRPAAYARCWRLALAQLNQLHTVYRGAEPEPLTADADIMFADFLAAMAAGE